MASDTFKYDANGNVIGRYDGNTGEF